MEDGAQGTVMAVRSGGAWLHRGSWASGVALLALLVVGCAAQPEPPADDPGEVVGDPSPCEQLSDDEVPVIDFSRRFLAETTCGAALWLDGLFGDPDVEAAQRTHGYLETSFEYSEFFGTDTDTRFRLETDLPNLRNRFSVFVGRDDEENVRRDREENFDLRTRFGEMRDSDWIAGVGYHLPSRGGLSSDLNVGAASLSHPRAYVQYKLRWLALDGLTNQISLRFTPFYNTRDGLGTTAGFDYNHLVTPDLLLRFTSVGTASQRLDGMSWGNSLRLYVNLKEQRSLTYQLYVGGETDEREPYREFGLRQIYRRPLVRDKLYGEFLLGYGWPRLDPAKEREGAAEAGLSLTLPFGSEKWPW